MQFLKYGEMFFPLNHYQIEKIGFINLQFSTKYQTNLWVGKCFWRGVSVDVSVFLGAGEQQTASVGSSLGVSDVI